jgi:L-ascorbate metabolism protein UlaG (beta-lactamase superfamily)
VSELPRNIPSREPYGTVALDELENPAATGVSLWWLGNGGFAINWMGRVIFIDPVIELKDDADPMTSEIDLPLRGPLPLRARDVRRADLALLSHDHGDHMGPRTTRELVARTEALFIGTERTVKTAREYGLGPDRLQTARYDEPIEVGDMTITPTAARHAEPESPAFPGEGVRGECCGFILRAGGLSLWHPCDTDVLEEHLSVPDIDVLILPIAPHNLGTEGSIRLAASTGARHLIPCHYGTYDSDLFWCVGDPDAVAAGVEDAERRYHVVAIGGKFVVPGVG